MELVFRQFSIRMSKAKMADVLYAVIMCRGKITSTFCLAYNYTREQNAYNSADIMVGLPECELLKFEELSGVHLQIPPKLYVNKIPDTKAGDSHE